MTLWERREALLRCVGQMVTDIQCQRFGLILFYFSLRKTWKRVAICCVFLNHFCRPYSGNSTEITPNVFWGGEGSGWVRSENDILFILR